MNTANMNILVVDDEPFVLQLTEKALHKLGYDNVDTARDGEFALGKLITNEKPYDLIICDLNMPKMDGVEFLRHAHDAAFNGGLIIYSGQDTRMLETSLQLAYSHDLHVIGALRKPVVMQELSTLMKSYVPVKEKRVAAPFQPISIAELRRGIMAGDDGPIRLVYQPKIQMSTGEIVGVEALARWQHAHRGLIGPHTFIPLAESTGLIEELSRVVFRKAVQTVAQWNERGLYLTMSVNFAVSSFADSELSDFVMEILEEYQVSPAQINLEVTETQVMDNSTSCLETMMRMRLKNFGLAIDDFGTGSSSMTQLKRIPFTELKIDRAFVHGATHDTAARAIVEASVDLAKKLDMQIVAEGAETKEDWDLVERLGCDYVQGFYCAKPMPEQEIVEFYDNWAGPHRLES